MKSPMITNADYIKSDEKGRYSELKVLSSAAGYYVGTTYTDPDYGFEEPGSRDSDYFKTREQAQKFFDSLSEEDPEDVPFLLRSHP